MTIAREANVYRLAEVFIIDQCSTGRSIRREYGGMLANRSFAVHR